MAPGVMWTKEDCDKLNELVNLHGKKWTPIASLLGAGKTGKQCRRQWERLNIETKQCGWSSEEDALLLEYHKQLGNKWTRISKMIGGRTDNAVKNRYHALKLKQRSRHLARNSSLSTSEPLLGKRCLRNCNSLEERRAAKEKVEHVKADESLVYCSSGGAAGGMFFKSEPLQQTTASTGPFASSFGDRWTGGCVPSSNPRSLWIPQQSACMMPCAVTLPYGISHGQTPEVLNCGAQQQQQQQQMQLQQQPTYFSFVSQPNRPTVPSPNRLTDDSDSMESSSENKIDARHSDCLSNFYSSSGGGGGGHVVHSPVVLGTNMCPLPSRVLEEGQQQQQQHQHRQIESTSGTDGSLVQDSTSGASNQKKVPELTLDLSFQQKADGFDFDSFLHSVSPMSSSAYLRFLTSLSPMNRQSSCVSDHESHMKE